MQSIIDEDKEYCRNLVTEYEFSLLAKNPKEIKKETATCELFFLLNSYFHILNQGSYNCLFENNFYIYFEPVKLFITNIQNFDKKIKLSKIRYLFIKNSKFNFNLPFLPNELFYFNCNNPHNSKYFPNSLKIYFNSQKYIKNQNNLPNKIKVYVIKYSLNSHILIKKNKKIINPNFYSSQSLF